MAGPLKEKLETHTSHEEGGETESSREVFLRDGKKLVVTDQGSDQIVEIRNESGMLEVRIKLTDEGPVLQMDALRLSMKSTQSVEIESQKVSIKAETIALDGGSVSVSSEEDIKVDAKNELRLAGKMIYLN